MLPHRQQATVALALYKVYQEGLLEEVASGSLEDTVAVGDVLKNWEKIGVNLVTWNYEMGESAKKDQGDIALLPTLETVKVMGRFNPPLKTAFEKWEGLREQKKTLDQQFETASRAEQYAPYGDKEVQQRFAKIDERIDRNRKALDEAKSELLAGAQAAGFSGEEQKALNDDMEKANSAMMMEALRVER